MAGSDLVCFSHLQWDFVYQRPNHLMARAARDRRVYFVQEPTDGPRPRLDMKQIDGVTIVTPFVSFDLLDEARDAALRGLMDGLLATEGIQAPVLWYYTPMPLPWTSHLRTSAVVYDVMDELSQFRFAPAELLAREQMLLERADVVFTGGRQLYEAKRNRHVNVHLFPSSVDVAHFGSARDAQPDPDDQASIPHPRVGYFGVIDERIDVDLVSEIARRRPDWQLVLVGPVAKIDQESLPTGPNVHCLGAKRYEELPRYLAGWDAAIMPFALNEATRYISPTKTPEYLAGGRPVASTSVRDVVEPYGTLGLVNIGDGADEFEGAIESALATDVADLRRRADAFLRRSSWDRTWREMDELVAAACERTAPVRRPAAAAAAPGPSARRVPAGARMAQRTATSPGATAARTGLVE